jgi:hypothetical protein
MKLIKPFSGITEDIQNKLSSHSRLNLVMYSESYTSQRHMTANITLELHPTSMFLAFSFHSLTNVVEHKTWSNVVEHKTWSLSLSSAQSNLKTS